MTSEVEKRRDSISRAVPYGGALRSLNELIALARAEGVAEGTAQERERIRKASEYTGMSGTYIVPAAYLGYPPAPALAPTKEVAG